MSSLVVAIQISLIGMAGTFAVLLLLHLMIAALARLRATPPPDVRPDDDLEEVAAILAVLDAHGIGPKTGGQVRIEKVSR